MFEKKWISPKTTASYLGFSLNSVYQKILSGQIPASRLGKKWLVDRVELDRLLTKNSILRAYKAPEN